MGVSGTHGNPPPYAPGPYPLLFSYNLYVFVGYFTDFDKMRVAQYLGVFEGGKKGLVPPKPLLAPL